MKQKKWTLDLLISLEGTGIEESSLLMTGQMARDKILTPIQELWILGHLKRFSLTEIDSSIIETILKIDGKNKSFKNEKEK